MIKVLEITHIIDYHYDYIYIMDLMTNRLYEYTCLNSII